MHVPTSIRALALLAAIAARAEAQNVAPRSPQELGPALGGVAAPPSIATAFDTTVAAFSEIDNGVSRVWAVRSNGRGVVWGPPVRVDRDPQFALKVTQSDSVQRAGANTYVFWIDDRSAPASNSVYFNVSTDGGATFGATDVAVPHPYGGNGELNAMRIASGPTPFGDGLHVAMRVAPSVTADEELWITSSLDGGATWNTPQQLAGDSANGIDVDQFAMAIANGRLHVVWEDDAANGAGRYSVRHSRSLDHGLTFGTGLALDTTDTADLGNADAPGEFGLQVRAHNDQVVVGWVEERTHPDNEEVRLAISLDGGASFSADERIGGGDPSTVDVDYIDVWVRQAVVLVALTDNRAALGNSDQLYVWRRPIAGGSATETALTAGDAAFPRFAGAGAQVAVAWLSDSPVRQSLSSRTTEDLALTWQPVARIHDSLNSRDVDNASIAFDPAYDNVLAAFLVDSGVGGTNRALSGGVRPPTLVPQGFAPKGPFISFRGENLVEGDATLLLVGVGFTAAEGSLVLPDLRDVGLAYDALTAAGINLIPSLVAPIQPNGVANTPALVNGLPPGLTFRAVGLTMSPTVGTIRLTDVVTIVTQ
jgi:hypothetical protein